MSPINMVKLIIAVCYVAAFVCAGPSLRRSKEEIQNFTNFLKKIRKDDGLRLEQRMNAIPNAKEWENSGKFEGDILLDDEQVRRMVEKYSTGRNAYILPNTKWPNNTIVYEFGKGEFSDEQRENITVAIGTIEANTCLKFRHREPEEFNYVRLTGGPGGCYANVGYRSTRGIHTLNLASGCFRQTTIIHEWIHIIGFYHMQSTHNRNEFVEIMWENILPGTDHNFNKYDSDTVSNLDVKYDYASVMHYSAYSFSSNGLPTIVALHDDDKVMGQRDYVSDDDWLKINKHYNCAA